VSAGKGLERIYDTHTERLKSVVREMWEGMREETNTERTRNGHGTNTET
jgi:hypothetical protein